ncbi:hypothetical protein HPB52_010798 [Rhipicephalus sanguineus]|uniref:Uncharacterized protein n=1 Tax=Rhipicephalus sanguineus TaxID=34632 RepID=A0A9D4SW61_RHISA|nr:hypothetical protein HPB52_010798 [Rhipicephalus sanguineus]
MASQPPKKALAFDVVVPEGASPEDVVDETSSVVGIEEVYCVQHFGGRNYQVTANSEAALAPIVDASHLNIRGERVAIVPLGPQVTQVTVLFLPCRVPSEALAQALSPYGKVLHITKGLMGSRPTVTTGTRSYSEAASKDFPPLQPETPASDKGEVPPTPVPGPAQDQNTQDATPHPTPAASPVSPDPASASTADDQLKVTEEIEYLDEGQRCKTVQFCFEFVILTKHSVRQSLAIGPSVLQTKTMITPHKQNGYRSAGGSN